MKAKKLLSLLLVFVLAVSLVSTAFAAGTEKSFSDVGTTHWARAFVDRLVAADAADGYPDGTYKPSQYITRVEFMKLLNGVCGFTAKSDDVKNFTDVQAPWKVEQVAIALAAGYTNGTGPNKMSPNANITREMAVTMICRAVKLDAEAADLSVLSMYTDSGKISSYAVGCMA